MTAESSSRGEHGLTLSVDKSITVELGERVLNARPPKLPPQLLDRGNGCRLIPGQTQERLRLVE